MNRRPTGAISTLRRADIEGYPDVGAGLFRDTSEAETGHALRAFGFSLKEVGDPADWCADRKYRANLKSAIEGETYEYTQMYPGMAKTARDEGFSELWNGSRTLAKADGPMPIDLPRP